jgi:hypothetical protein
MKCRRKERGKEVWGGGGGFMEQEMLSCAEFCDALVDNDELVCVVPSNQLLGDWTGTIKQRDTNTVEGNT